jgi:pyruvate kinase
MEGEHLREALQVADAVRLNASHGDLESRAQSLNDIRRIAKDLGRRIPVLLDLQGPKWRVGALAEPLELP